METSNGTKDGPGTASTAVEGGSKSGSAEVHPRQDVGDDTCSMEIDEDTQILGPSSHNGGADDGDGAESSGSSAADESGGTNRSSGGYSGDYSSISDSSSDRDKEGKKQAHRKAHGEPRAAAAGADAATKLDGGDGPPDDAAQKLDRGGVAGNGAKAQAKTEVNRKIDEIMNLYDVSLRASAIRDAEGKLVHAPNAGGKMPKRGSTSSIQVEASGLPDEHLGSKAPQLSGLRLQDPLDQRIDAQQLYRTAMLDLSRNATAAQKAVGALPRHLEGPEDGTMGEVQGSDCYTNLMEACRPFFRDGQSVLTASQRSMPKLKTPDMSIKRPPPIPPQQKNGSDGAQSSSGFTSFFTTTNSGSNQTHSGSGGSFSDKSSQRAVAGEGQKQVSNFPDESSENAHAHPDDIGDDDQSDSSSMIVLARVKRKHKSIEKAEAGQQTEALPRQATASSNTTDDAKTRHSNDANTGGSSKRVRIETVAVDKSRRRSASDPTKPEAGQCAGSSLTSSLTQSLDSSGSDSNRGRAKKNEEGSNVEGSSNAESGSGQNQPSADTGQSNANGKPRVVTDTGTTTVNGSSGSGTGSGNDANTNSNKSESGSGGGNSDQKVAGERDSTGSDGAGGLGANESAVATKPESEPVKTVQTHPQAHLHHHTHGGHLPYEGENRKMLPDESVMANQSLSRRCCHSPRRLGTRAFHRFILSFIDVRLTPRRCLCCRLLVQALPPFLAVHVNAAFTSLCGIQSSAAIGAPVASILSLPDANAPANKESNSSGSDDTNNKDAMSSLSGNSQDDNSNMAIADNDAAPEAAQAPGVQANALQNDLGLRIDRLIVARGYGHIHDVEVLSVPHHSHAHAIEGSEVKFVEGDGPAKRQKRNKSKILCRMSVSPVISSSPPAPYGHGCHRHTEGTQSSGGGKRRKIEYELSSVKHYLIQLEAVDGPRLLVSRSSFTSSSTDTTMEAKLLGITKTEVHARRCGLEGRAGQNPSLPPPQGSAPSQTEDSQDGDSGAMEPVATCG
ncbi:hypothetical protein ACHAXT_011680 [Thalassiosira profunda]